jgi:hypothetical protein
MTHKQTKRQLQAIYFFELYKRTFGVDEADCGAAAEWAFAQGLWKRPQVNPVEILRREIARALRGQYIEDAPIVGVASKWCLGGLQADGA